MRGAIIAFEPSFPSISVEVRSLSLNDGLFLLNFIVFLSTLDEENQFPIHAVEHKGTLS